MVAGQLVIKEGVEGLFRYERSYCEASHSFALHPSNQAGLGLPLGNTLFRTHHPSGLFATFRDIVPEGWGRLMLIRQHQRLNRQSSVAQLLGYTYPDPIGALQIITHGQKPEMAWCSMMELEQLVDAAHRLLNRESIPEPVLRALFKGGSSVGGGRPKVVVKDSHDSIWLVKLSQPTDSMNLPAVEAATLELAHHYRLNTPPFRLKMIAGQDILMVKRFDCLANGGRVHVMSMQALMGVHSSCGVSYADLAKLLRRYSYRPRDDLEQLCRLMLFNILIGNIDDHLKNFSVVRDREGWCLSPVYDLLPSRANQLDGMGGYEPSYHSLKFLADEFPPTGSELQQNAREFGMSAKEMARLIDELLTLAETAATPFAKCHLTASQTAQIMADIAVRAERLAR